MSVLGIDVDGILCSFTNAYIQRIRTVTGMDMFPADFDGEQTSAWDFEKAYGYSKADISRVWESIKEDDTFWSTLPPYNDAEAAMFYLRRRYTRGDDIYFITSRVGQTAKSQTTEWLNRFNAYLGNGVPNPTVLIVRGCDKGLACRALKVDHFLDDKQTNCEFVRDTSPGTKVYLMDRPWNRDRELYAVKRVFSVDGFIEAGE